ncbi:fimbrial protein [Hafnia alvei]|uniref:Major type 1 subunit fimbrin (Pilin) n=1 Tax=Hafnia alvei TaxID=569 RepID=A0A1C6Z2E8_HAFAL|nr:fimbrial protein [Hafnia alvei]SCM53171.1 major type 1 subunit fimbrin (pilin) [Hafnia alvei]
MKASKMLVSALSVLTMMAAGSAMAAPVATPITVNGGSINFTGEVTDAACIVNPESVNQTYALSPLKTSEVAAGKTGASTEVRIYLEECSTEVYKTASFAFKGVPDLNDPTVLANAPGAGGARGVGVQMKDMDGKVINFTAADDKGAKMQLIEGTNVAIFSAALVGTSETATPGHVSATTDFKVHYE